MLESLAGPRLVSATARRHGISRSQLLIWRRTFKPEPLAADQAPGPTPTYVPMLIEPEPPSATQPVASKPDRVAAELGESDDALFDLIDAMEPEDGLIWVYGPGDEQCPAFTGEGIDYLKDRIAFDKADPNLPPPKP